MKYSYSIREVLSSPEVGQNFIIQNKLGDFEIPEAKRSGTNRASAVPNHRGGWPTRSSVACLRFLGCSGGATKPEKSCAGPTILTTASMRADTCRTPHITSTTQPFFISTGWAGRACWVVTGRKASCTTSSVFIFCA